MRPFIAFVDPAIVVLAAACGLAIFVVQEGPVAAVLGGASVLAVGLVTERLMRRARTRPVGPWFSPLTPRRAEIAQLIAEGLTNKEIATRLGIGERGVEGTVLNILNELGFHNRTQIAVWIRERQRRAAPEDASRTTPKR